MTLTTLEQSVDISSQNYYTFIREQFGSDNNRYSKLTGRFYTNEFIYSKLVQSILDNLNRVNSKLHIIDPFCGDGRLIVHLIEALMKTKKSHNIERIFVSLWDVDKSAVAEAKNNVIKLNGSVPGLSVLVDTNVGDSFVRAIMHNEKYDICITNPPWCILKPEKEDINYLSSKKARFTYTSVIEEYEIILKKSYKHSMPKKKSWRWGTNLSRFGAECAMKLVVPNGVCGIVLPASLFSDQVSEPLRKWMFEDHAVKTITYYPAELKLFGTVDQSSATVVLKKSDSSTTKFTSTIYDKNRNCTDAILDSASVEFVKSTQYVVPFGYDRTLFSIANQLKNLNPLSEYPNIKIGRELDETRINMRLTASGTLRFIKGFMVGRYSCLSGPVCYLNATETETAPESTRYERIAWRDVSRSSQKRRVQATIIPSGTITGNSLGILYVPEVSHAELAYILAVMNSMVFEFQARRQLVTNHVPSGVLKTVSIPPFQEECIRRIGALADIALGSSGLEATDELECLVAKAYGLTKEDFLHIVDTFPLTDNELARLQAVAEKTYGNQEAK